MPTTPPPTRRPLVHYAPWPLDYPNAVPKREASAFAAAGYDTVYVAGIGIRNPRASSALKALDRLGRVARGPRPAAAAGGTALRTASLLVAPPRQRLTFRRGNARWVAAQLRRMAAPWPEAVAWIWYPTPELVDALALARPAAVVYEAYDALEFTPGMTGRWKERILAADHALASSADAVIATSQALVDRYAELGIPAEHMPPGVDVPAVVAPRRNDAVTAGFVGTLDHRVDVSWIRALAAQRPDWRIRLVGPVQESFPTQGFDDLANVVLEPPVPNDRLHTTIAGFDVGLMPYVRDELARYMSPVKNLEFMAAGIPAVAPPLRALEPFRDLLYFASSAEEFASAAQRAVAEDDEGRVCARRAAAREQSWPHRHRAHLDLLHRLGVQPGG
ncbi:MAG: glycosyltransferase [Solirubrobacterales bacterium]|nr:glycosyltransferase [Solirubrobacterales bacterium]